MKLSISNLAKIKQADIDIDGITVVAGENNTGKSTIGKVLFSTFNSLYNITDKIYNQRLKEIDSSNKEILQNHIKVDQSYHYVIKYILYVGNCINRYISNADNQKNMDSKDKIITDLRKEIEKNDENVPDYFNDYETTVEEIANNIIRVMNVSEDVLMKEIISRYFSDVFNGQINSLSIVDGNELAEVLLKINDKQNRILFGNNVCGMISREINIQHKAIYIDNPFIIDGLSKNQNPDIINKSLKDLFVRENENILDDVIGSVIAKEKLNTIEELLDKVVDGDISNNSRTGELYLQNKEYKEPIALSNLSTGVKSFAVLKMLLEKGSLYEKDVLILDEPEIHLHPQWQIEYAELLVLLQKQFNLSVIVTTHSPYFVDAINLFSCKYETDNAVNYYMSVVDYDGIKMEKVTDNIDKIYKKMASPIEVLDTLRYELNNN